MEDERVRARKNLIFSYFYPTRILVGYLRGIVSKLFIQLSFLFLKNNFFFKILINAINVLRSYLFFILK